MFEKVHRIRQRLLLFIRWRWLYSRMAFYSMNIVYFLPHASLCIRGTNAHACGV
jgi:hypothetical protein